MHDHPETHVYERQRTLLATAAEQRSAQWLRRVSRATRRAERAERQLSRSWSQAARRHAELSRIADAGPS
jgi:hypothetical protein